MTLAPRVVQNIYMSSLRAHQIRALFIFIALISLGIFGFSRSPLRKLSSDDDGQNITKSQLAQVIGDSGAIQKFPTDVELPMDGKLTQLKIEYAFDPVLQKEMEGLFQRYRPDYGAFVAIDASTGRVLSMVSYVHAKDTVPENLTLRATFPSASVFKVVTAAAAIAERNFTANTVIPFNGRNHTLYRSHVLGNKITRWTRYITLKDAFAKSVNTVFGRIGAFTVGAEELRQYADRFGFNRTISADVPMEQGRAEIKDDPWALAETASGFTRENTMSPLQGALIAAAVVNDGKMMEPYVVDSVRDQEGKIVYHAVPRLATLSVDAVTASEIRALMKETIVDGTSKKAFRGFYKGQHADLEVGGKTGSLTGSDPEGKYDWFVGFGDNKERRIAVAALTVHKKLWRVKSSYLARRAFEEYFRAPAAAKEQEPRSRRKKKGLPRNVAQVSSRR